MCLNSNLGADFLARGKKVLFLPFLKKYDDSFKNPYFKKNFFFVIKKNSKKKIFDKLNLFLNLRNLIWKKKLKLSKIKITFDKNNSILKTRLLKSVKQKTNKIMTIENICIVEDKEDFDLIFNKCKNNDSIYVPLDIETLILCKNKNLNIFDFNKYLSNQFHFTALKETDRFKNTLKFKNISYSLKSEIIGYLRFRLHSIIFVIEIVENICKNNKIKNNSSD